eukprot:g9701.t1
MLAGCSQLNPTDIQADCVPPRRWHFAFESWQEGRPYVRPALLAMGEYAPASLGSPGYAGYQGLFGSTCPGSDSLQVLPGYFSTVDAPGEIYRCFGDVGKCPGGPPGTCALGRDRRSVACSRCESGKHAEADGTCRPCVGLDFAIFISTSVLVIMVITALYLGLLKTKRHPSPLLIVTISLAQMITIAQKLTVLAKFKIGWDEPFLSVLHSIQLLNFDLKHISIDCISQVAPLVEFSIRVLLMPLFCLLVLIVHFLYSAFFSKRSMCGSFQLAQLGRTVGTIFIICFISVFSSLLLGIRRLSGIGYARTHRVSTVEILSSGSINPVQSVACPGLLHMEGPNRQLPHQSQ